MALAFGGIISRIAITHLEEKSVKAVKHLDKEYLRRYLMDTDAIARSRRSDEVVVFGKITKARELPIKIKKCQRFLCPGFEKIDSSFFPASCIFLQRDNFLTEKPLSGPNKRLFRINIMEHSWITLLPRPNYSLEDPLYFDEKLVELSFHHFACYNAYRQLTKHIPRAALYVFDLSVEDDIGILPSVCSPYEFQWAFILLEDFNLENIDSQKVLSKAQELFTVDLLLGNWECVGGAKDEKGLASQSEAMYGITRSDRNIVVRIGVDRALGCIYPEDESKKNKTPVKFETKNIDYLQAALQHHFRWCFGNISNRDIVEGILQLKLEDNLAKLERVLKTVKWPPWCHQQKTESIWNVVQSRIDDLMQRLPYYIHKKTIISNKSFNNPPERDSHGVVSLGNKLFIAGGNSMTGTLKDLWMFDSEKVIWQKLDDMPGLPRYSFSMHLWNYNLMNHMIAIYGGCNPKTGMLNDLMIYHIERKQWIPIVVVQNNDGSITIPEPRCRQGSNIVNKENGTAEMYVLGGINGDNKRLKDVWKAKFSFTDEDLPMVQWEYLNIIQL